MPGVGDTEVFSRRLQMLKDRSGLSYGSLAARLHVSTSALHRYCSGAAVPHDSGLVDRAGRLCGASRDELIELHRLWIRADAQRARRPAGKTQHADQQSALSTDSSSESCGSSPEPPALPAISAPISFAAWGLPAGPHARRTRKYVVAAAVIALAVSLAADWTGHGPAARQAPHVTSGHEIKGAWPLGWWRLDESEGTAAADASGNGNDGTFNQVTWVPGRWGNAASLTSGYLTVNHAVTDTTHSFTVSAWVRLTNADDWATAVSQNGQHTCAFALQYNAAAHRWGFGMPESDTPSDGHNPVVRYTNSTAPPALNTWTHLTAVYDAAPKTSRLYVDGTPQGPATPVIAWPARANFLIGATRWDNVTGVNQWPGQIDDVRIYNHALTPAQIRQLP